MVKIQKLNKLPPVHLIALTKEIIDSTAWEKGDEIIMNVIIDKETGQKRVILENMTR